MTKFLIIIFIIFFFFRDLKPQPIVLSCSVLDEIENDEPARKKLFKDKKINLFLDLKKDWLNDLQKNELIESDDSILKRVQYELTDNNKVIIFRYFQYFTEKKKELELHSLIKLNKLNNSFSFIKFYYEQSNKIFFKSEINGLCDNIN